MGVASRGAGAGREQPSRAGADRALAGHIAIRTPQRPRRVFVDGEDHAPWIAGGTPEGALNPCPAPACLSFPAWTVGARTPPVAEVLRGAPSAGSAPFSLLFR